MKQGLRRAAHGIGIGALAALALSLMGCGNFFIKDDGSGGSGTSGGTTGSYVYMSNSSASSQTISAYAISAGALTAVSGSPFTVNYSPSALVVSRANTYLYASNVANATIYAYSISSTGALSNSVAVANAIDALSMDVSPDGQWLFALDSGGTTLNEYQINTSTGALTLEVSQIYSGASLAALPSSVRVAPSGSFVVLALGTAGDIIYPFTTSTGQLGTPQVIPPPVVSGDQTGDYSAAFDNNNYLYVARTTGLVSYSVTAAGVATQLNTAATGGGPRSIVFNKTYTAVYDSNQADGTISGFGLSGTAVMTPLTNSPYASAPTVSQLATDNTGNFLVAVGYGASGATVYTIGSSTSTGPGVLTSPASVATGTLTTVPAVLAVTH